MTNPNTPFTAPIGRLVQGDAFKPSEKDQNGALRTVKTGPNAGQPNPQFFIAVAYPKSPGVTTMDAEIATGSPVGKHLAEIRDEAARAFPHLFQGGVCSHPQFSFKVTDGDGIDQSGKRWSDREGFAGHWVVKYSRGASIGAPGVFREASPGTFVETRDCKAGWFIQVNGTITGNTNAQRPGVYVNLGMICVRAEGQEIIQTSGPSAAEAFGGSGAALPPGAAPLSAPAPVMPSAPAPAPAPAAPVRAMLPAANGVTYEAYIAAGWTDTQLVASGYMAA
jgi:hypothetical protein